MNNNKVRDHATDEQVQANVTADKSPTKDLLLLGAEGSGKTLLSRRLNECNLNFVDITPENTVPTTGTDIIYLNINGKDIPCREVGSAMSSTWEKYLLTSSHILFVIDISDPGSYPSAMIHLTEILNSLKDADEKDNKAVPAVLIVFNKSDLADSTTCSMAMNIFRFGDMISLYETSKRNIQLFSGNSMNFQLAKVLLKWLRSDLCDL